MRWHAVNMNEFAGDWRVRNENDVDVLTLRYGHHRGDDHAHLAAAAPEMLAVLEQIAALIARGAEVPHEVRAEVRRVIALAKGESEVPF